MSFLDSIGSAIGDVVSDVSDVAKGVEGVAGSLLGGSTGGVVGSLLGDALGGPLGGMIGGSLLPQLLGSLLGNNNQSQNQSIQPFPFPFSTGGLSNYLQNPSQLLNTLGSGPGVGSSSSLGGFLGNLDTAGVDSQVTNLMNSAQQAAQNGDAMTAQKDMIQAQTLFQTISQLMNQIGSLQKEALQNSKLQ
jgi:hypothetical protein